MVKAADIVTDLLSNNVCKYCCMRYINEKNPSTYTVVDKYLKELLGKVNCEEDYTPPVKQKKQNPCSACLGVLQLSEDSEFLGKIITEVKAAGYDSDDVTFALSLPITVMLRDCSVWLYVSNKYPEYFDDPFNAVTLRRQHNTVAIKEVWKWVSAEKIAGKLEKSVNNGVDGNFHVIIHLLYEKDSSETSCLLEMFPDIFKCRANQKRKFHGEILTRKSVESALLEVDLNFFKQHYPVPPKIPDCFVTCEKVECNQDSIYLAGRYNKFSRSLSQTPWVINGERKMESSVEEIISAPVFKVVQHSGIRFSSSGREDVDVRTLGKGRPFVLEIINPRRIKLHRETLKKLENDINNSTKDVFVRDLQVVDKEDLGHIKLGEESKTKTYTCYCITKLKEDEDIDSFKKKLEDLKQKKDIVIQQKTPIRVLHRRSLAKRARKVFWMEAEYHKMKVNQIFFKLKLQVEAGTYIKEFVHGDFFRTKPNLSEILQQEVDILALDVEEVALQWPPSLEDEDLPKKTNK